MSYYVIGKRLLLKQLEDDTNGLIYNQDLLSYEVLDKGEDVKEISVGDTVIVNKQNVITTKFKKDTIRVTNIDSIICYIPQGEE